MLLNLMKTRNKLKKKSGLTLIHDGKLNESEFEVTPRKKILTT